MILNYLEYQMMVHLILKIGSVDKTIKRFGISSSQHQFPNSSLSWWRANFGCVVPSQGVFIQEVNNEKTRGKQGGKHIDIRNKLKLIQSMEKLNYKW